MPSMYPWTHPWAPPVTITPVDNDEDQVINDFKIGCDPEFMLLNERGATVAASQYMGHDGPVGYDHGGRVAELRPTPSVGILPLVQKLRSLIMTDPVVSLKQKLRAGAICNQDCLGGHVHFGFNAFEIRPMEGYSILNGGGIFNARGAKVTKALDALTRTLEHLDILPHGESGKRRASAQGQGNYYGAYGDVRDCHGHMEYRTMASWLYDPKVAFLCLTAAKLAAADPDGAIGQLMGREFVDLQGWIDKYKTKDRNAARAVEKLLDKGLPHLQVDPSVDFKERWVSLGL